jgi:hypothetical protein
MGRTTSLTAFLSQWSSASRANGPENLARTSVPALLLTYTADHYLAGRADLQAQVADEIAAFAESL